MSGGLALLQPLDAMQYSTLVIWIRDVQTDQILNCHVRHKVDVIPAVTYERGRILRQTYAAQPFLDGSR